MKTVRAVTFLLLGAGLMPAAIIENISLDLSALHPGSTLSGTFTLSDTPLVGDTASATLTFSDPADYSPTSLLATISILNGTPTGFAIDFSQLSFTNLSGTTTPINTRDVSLSRFFFATCQSFPCTATGLFQDRSPAVFSAQYTITPASSAPEPGYGLLLSAGLAAIVFRRRLARFSSSL